MLDFVKHKTCSNLRQFGVESYQLRICRDYQHCYQQAFPQHCGIQIQVPVSKRKNSKYPHSEFILTRNFDTPIKGIFFHSILNLQNFVVQFFGNGTCLAVIDQIFFFTEIYLTNRGNDCRRS
jgi:hypothetical protein